MAKVKIHHGKCGHVTEIETPGPLDPAGLLEKHADRRGFVHEAPASRCPECEAVCGTEAADGVAAELPETAEARIAREAALAGKDHSGQVGYALESLGVTPQEHAEHCGGLLETDTQNGFLRRVYCEECGLTWPKPAPSAADLDAAEAERLAAERTGAAGGPQLHPVQTSAKPAGDGTGDEAVHTAIDPGTPTGALD